MKYFTPELLDRYGSIDDAVADQAQADWEQASAEYQRHYKTIETSLPTKLREVLGRFYLHDARLFGVSLELPYLFLTLQLDTPPHEVLVFQYHLVKEPEILRSNESSDSCPYVEWLYDELEVKNVDNIVYLEHAILLTNGVELRIPFLRFDHLVQSPPFQSWPTGVATIPAVAARPQFIS